MTRLVTVAAVALFLLTGTAGAYNQHISSVLWAEGYSVPARDGSPIGRRRFVEELRLGAWNLIPGSEDPYYRGTRLSLEVALRLDTDFAVGRDESDSSMDSAYVPGLTPVQMDALVAFADVSGLWDEHLDLRAGRQIRLDTLGFFAFDGVETRLHLPLTSALHTYVGYEVRGGNLLGYDQLELEGTDSGGRHDMEPDRYPDRSNPTRRLAVGTALTVAPFSWLDGGVSFRTVGLSRALGDERLGGRLTVGREPFTVDGRVVYSPLLEELVEADAAIIAVILERLSLIAEYHLYRPLFEADSIFNVFDLSPQNDAGGRLELRLTERFSVAAWGFARLSEGSAGISGEEEDALVAGAGGGAGGSYRTRSADLNARLSSVHEWGESMTGAELGAGHLFFRSRLRLGLRVSFWQLDDSMSEQLSGTLAGWVASARFRLSDGAHFLGEFEQYVGGGREPRYTALAMLQLDMWR